MSGMSVPRVSLSHRGSIKDSMVVADTVIAPPPCRGAAADWTMFCQKAKVELLIPPTVPVPASAMIACVPPIWFDAVPSEYRSVESPFLNEFIAFFSFAFVKLMMRDSPELVRISRPEAETLTAT